MKTGIYLCSLHTVFGYKTLLGFKTVNYLLLQINWFLSLVSFPWTPDISFNAILFYSIYFSEIRKKNFSDQEVYRRCR